MAMRNLRAISLFGLVLFFIYASDASGLSQTKQGSRKQKPVILSFELRHTLTREEADAQQGVVRGALWHLWSSRTKGTVRVTSYTLEGNPLLCRYSVEADKMGRWNVSSKCEGSVCPFISTIRCRKYLTAHLT